MTRVRIAVVAALTAMAMLPTAASGREACTAPEWPMYGHDLEHSFEQSHECASIDYVDVARLIPKWVVPTNDSVTAQPTVDNGTVYVGAWDGTFYAVDAVDGAVKWTFSVPDDHRVAFGRIVSTAAVTTFAGRDGRQQKAVIFGGGATLYALSTAGEQLAAIDLDPRDAARRKAQAADPPQVEIESSPAVSDIATPAGNRRTIYVGLDVHNARDVGRTGIVALTLDESDFGRWRFNPVWKFDAEAGKAYEGAAGLTTGSGTGLGCGGVWSSPAVDPAAGLVFFGTSSCSHPEDARKAGMTSGESMMAVDAATGRLRWSYQPASSAEESHLDDDFGASPNLFRTKSGKVLIGQGRKSGQYFGRDRLTGNPIFTSVAGAAGHVRQDFSVGGFLGTPAVWHAPDGTARAIIGGTAIPVPESAEDVDRATWSVRAIDPEDGHLLWVYRLTGPTYGSTTIANGVALVADTFTSTVIALDAATGQLLSIVPTIGPPSSAPISVGDSIYLGAGTRETDAEFKAFGNELQSLFQSTVGNHPLSPLSGIQAFVTA